MNKDALRALSFIATIVIALGISGCQMNTGVASEVLTGAWRGKVQFTTGAFAAVKDLDFMYEFNAGGTMTESSNYDGMPPVPPAYGVWRQVGPKQFEAKYEYYWTKPPVNFDEIAKGGGWMPGGHGVLIQKITVSEDGNTFDSTIKYESFDQQGKLTELGSDAVASGVRIKF